MNITDVLDQLILHVSNPAQDIAFGWTILGWLYVLGFLIYVFFAVIVIRQIQMMSQTFTTPIRGILLTFAFIHLLFAIGVLLMAFMSLV